MSPPWERGPSNSLWCFGSLYQEDMAWVYSHQRPTPELDTENHPWLRASTRFALQAPHSLPCLEWRGMRHMTSSLHKSRLTFIEVEWIVLCQQYVLCHSQHEVRKAGERWWDSGMGPVPKSWRLESAHLTFCLCHAPMVISCLYS